MGAREFDIVLFGATGFTGKLVAEYLGRTAERAGAKWAVAGRSAAKLEAVKKDLGLDVPVLVADAHDEAALDALAPRTRVVCTTVGPFVEHGNALVDACARHGTHYCDSTGEVPFVRGSIDRNHEKAKETRARIVHCCGFDSIPFDLGVHLAWSKHEKALKWAKSMVGPMKGGASGGTVATMMALMEAASRDPSVRRTMGNAHALDPDPRAAPRRPEERDARGVAFDADAQRWSAPFVMAAVNTRIVRRSNALLDFAYGKDFLYSEAMTFAKGPRGFGKALSLTLGLGGLVGAASFGPTRELVKRFAPKPGEGPSKELQESGFAKIRVFAETVDGERVEAKVACNKDPGYAETATMLGESSLCLAEGAAALPPRHGVLTPATAMGMRLVERLRSAGMTFELV